MLHRHHVDSKWVACERRENAAVETLELHSCRLGVEGALVLAAGLRANPWVLRALSVSEVCM